jgi:eukaryotic-like serine/threonine-protein kinase
VSSPALCPHGNSPNCPLCAAMGYTVAASGSSSSSSETLSPLQVPPLTPLLVRTIASKPREPTSFPFNVLPAIPNYDVLELLGHGGMGVVYKAWHQQLKRPVALKMMRAGVHATREAALRFRFEAEAVARLAHSHIVQIHEIGEHEGLPFLALEFVEGQTLADVAQTRPFAPRRAAELVETLARAIGHAHQRGVVHRDLKPANVLLTADGVPKITDFGLAKRLDEERSQTRDGAILGTPSYMSPEQAAGHVQEIGPATDVHALGVILYELLTGTPPFDGPTTYETVLKVINEEPVAPTRLKPAVPRDLEIITIKCLQKDPAKRYSSAVDLADDLRRWLNGEPIQARPANVWERGVKWAKRRPTIAALLAVSATAVLALLSGGVMHSFRVGAERDRAEANLEMAMQAVDDMLTEVGEEQLAYEPRMEEKRRRLLMKAQALYKEFLTQRHDSPRIRLQTALASRRVADIDRLLGDYREAETAYDDAIRRFDELLQGDPNNATYRRHLATSWNYRGEARRQLGETAGAEQAYQKALTLAEDERDRALTRMNLGILKTETNQFDRAEDELNAAVALFGQLANDHPGEAIYRQYLARAHLNRGPVRRVAKRYAEAKADYEAAIALLLKLSEGDPNQPDYRHELGVAYNNLGNLRLQSNEIQEAGIAYRNAQRAFQELARNYPGVCTYRQELANSYNSVGNASAALGDLAGAELAWKSGVVLLEHLARQRPDVPSFQADHARLLGNIGWAASEQKDWPRARKCFTASIDLIKSLADQHPDNPQYKTILRDQYQSLAHTCVQLGDHAAAERGALDLANVFPHSARDSYFAACFVARCIPLAANDGDRSPEEQVKLEKQYRECALELLQAACHKGYSDRAELKKEKDGIFKPLAGSAAFQALLK